MTEQETVKSGVAMIRISGQRVRFLREQQELTQLYLATVVGVTTETISRWERKEAPTIKKENGLKLAEALGVPVEEILYREEQASEERGPEEIPSVAGPQGMGRPGLRAVLLWGGLALLVLVVLLLFFLPDKVAIHYSARRIMPPHTVAGRPFPIIIEVKSASADKSSLLLREQVPMGCRVLQTLPEAALAEGNILKWIEKQGEDKALFAYLATCGKEEEGNASYTFSGSLLARRFNRSELPITGRSRIQLRPFHWADRNSDGMIDDEELLGVYDDFAQVPGLGIDVEEVESIWMGSGYRWNAQKNDFEILP